MSQPYFPLGRWVSKCTFKLPLVEIFLLQIGQTKLPDELLSVFVWSTPLVEYTCCDLKIGFPSSRLSLGKWDHKWFCRPIWDIKDRAHIVHSWGFVTSERCSSVSSCDLSLFSSSFSFFISSVL